MTPRNGRRTIAGSSPSTARCTKSFETTCKRSTPPSKTALRHRCPHSSVKSSSATWIAACCAGASHGSSVSNATSSVSLRLAAKAVASAPRASGVAWRRVPPNKRRVRDEQNIRGHPLARLDDSDVADLLQVIRVRVVNWLVRKGVVESRDELTLLDNTDDADPSLTQLAMTPRNGRRTMAAVSGSIPAAPEIHQRPPVSLGGEPEITVVSRLCASSMGFTLHAATTVSTDDRRAREALARYVMRPPLAQERLHLLPNNLVTLPISSPKCCGENSGS
jgi:hypothetical protein